MIDINGRFRIKEDFDKLSFDIFIRYDIKDKQGNPITREISVSIPRENLQPIVDNSRFNT